MQVNAWPSKFFGRKDRCQQWWNVLKGHAHSFGGMIFITPAFSASRRILSMYCAYVQKKKASCTYYMDRHKQNCDLHARIQPEIRFLLCRWWYMPTWKQGACSLGNFHPIISLFNWYNTRKMPFSKRWGRRTCTTQGRFSQTAIGSENSSIVG